MARSIPTYPLPDFLEGIVKAETYTKWLVRKAAAHIRRDRRRGNKDAVRQSYRSAIHEAIKTSKGLDAYTGKPLDWELIGTYKNEKSKEGKRLYRKKFENLPTVDHVDDGLGAPNFKICSLRTNDCKSHLTHQELIEFCQDIIKYHENLARGPGQP